MPDRQVAARQDVVGAQVAGRAVGEVGGVLRRIADVLVLARGRWGVDDFSRRPETARSMIGVHGSLTSAEAVVPLLRTIT